MKIHTMQVMLDHNTTPHYAIEIIGSGKTKHYCLKRVTETGRVDPVDYKAYRTESAARDAAKDLGIEIQCVGDLWETI